MKKPEIDGFEIQSRIASGKRAKVYRAVQKSLSRTVAIKVLNPELAEDPTEIARFKLMASSTSNIRDSNIAICYGFQSSNGLNYMSSEYIGGETLDRRIRGGKALNRDEFMIMLRSAISALDAAWKQSELMHLNLKPSNILIGSDGIVKIIDFSGLTQSSCESICRALNFSNPDQPVYSPPELLVGESQLDLRSDIYSLGALCYQMATGRFPLAKSDGADSDGNLLIPNPLNVVPDISSDIAALIQKMMIIDPEARYGSWDELNEDVYRVADGGTPDTAILDDHRSAIADYSSKLSSSIIVAEKLTKANLGLLKICVITLIIINIYLIYLLLSTG